MVKRVAIGMGWAVLGRTDHGALLYRHEGVALERGVRPRHVLVPCFYRAASAHFARKFDGVSGGLFDLSSKSNQFDRKTCSLISPTS
jgi:hypothetical protein